MAKLPIKLPILPVPIRPLPRPYPIPFPFPPEYSTLHPFPDGQEHEFMLEGILYEGKKGMPQFDFNYTTE